MSTGRGLLILLQIPLIVANWVRIRGMIEFAYNSSLGYKSLPRALALSAQVKG